MPMEVLACLNGEIMPVEQARVPVWDRGFPLRRLRLRGLADVPGAVLARARTLARLRRSLKELDFPQVDLERLMDRVHRTIAASGIEEGTVYVQITRGVAPRAHAFPDPPVPPTELIVVRPYDDGPTARLRESGAGMISHPDLRWKRCDVKSTNLLGNVLAMEAGTPGGVPGSRASRLSGPGHRGHSFLTDLGAAWAPRGNARRARDPARDDPPAHSSPGGDDRIPFVPTRVTLPELLAADEVILFGTTIEVLPVVRIDDQTIGGGRPGPIARRLGDGLLHAELALAAMAEPARSSSTGV